MTLRLALAALLLSFTASALAAAHECKVEYRFTADWNAAPRRFHVDLLFDAGARTETDLGIARQWGPVTDFQRAIRDVRLIAPSGVVSPGRDAKTWSIDHPPGARVHVRYDVLNDVAGVDAHALGQVDFFRTMLGATWFQFYGWGAVLLPESIDPEVAMPVCLRFSRLPAGWRVATSHGEGRRARDCVEIRTTASLHELQSAIYLGGDFRVYRREIHGQPLVVAMRGKWGFDDAKLVGTTASLVRAQRDFWGDYDFRHFLVSLIPNRVRSGSTGGTGLFHSFAMHASDDFTVPGPDFDHLIGHEHLHTWIPWRLGAMGEDEARRYWFSEGFTDYLAHRLLLRSGLWNLDDYAKALDEQILRYESSTARNRPNSWLAKEFWKEPAAQRLPYLRGEMLALHWSAAMSGRGKSLQATLRSLRLPADAHDEAGAGHAKALAVDRLAARLRESLGEAADRDIAQYVDEGRTIPIGGDFLGPCFEGRTVERPLFELGWNETATTSSRKLTGLVPASAAQKAGLRDGMHVVGWSIYRGNTAKDVLVQVEDGNGKVTDIRYRPLAAQGIEVYEFHPRPGAASDRACRDWIEAR